MKQFFQVPKRIHNALMILCFIAEKQVNTPVALSLISNYLKLSHGYLEQIMPALKKAGLVKSYRGFNGGYILAKKPSQISLKDIIEALEGPIEVADCLKNKGCLIIKKCPSVNIWKKLQKELNDSFKKVKLSDI